MTRKLQFSNVCLLHLADDVVPSGVELVDAANLQIDFLDHPELQILSELQRADFVYDVQAPGAVEVEDGVEAAWISVKVNLICLQTVSVHLEAALFHVWAW